jgi:1-acyl-sn-glycerol-3-phosphate acyltransferase
MINFLKFLWALWILIMVLITGFLAVPGYWLFFTIGGEKAFRSAHKWVSRGWARTLIVCALIRIKPINNHRVDPKKAYVIISNHRSQLDIIACALSNPGVFKFLAKVDLLKVPFFGYAIKKMYITVKRESKEDRAKAVEKMAACLKEGISVHVYAEGTRNRGPEPLKKFYDGAFKLAVETGTPLAVMTIVNSGNLNAPGGLPMIQPGVISCYWEEPIETSEMTLDDLPALKNRCRQMMLSHLVTPEPEAVQA